jgi:hypothetical protein
VPFRVANEILLKHFVTSNVVSQFVKGFEHLVQVRLGYSFIYRIYRQGLVWIIILSPQQAFIADSNFPSTHVISKA